MSTNYEVWLNARHPKTLESIATVRVFHHADRARCEEVAERNLAEFACVVQVLRTLQPGALVQPEVRYPDIARAGVEAQLAHMDALEEARARSRAAKAAEYVKMGAPARRAVTADEVRVVGVQVAEVQS